MRIPWERCLIESVLISLLVVSAVGWQALAQEKSSVEIVPQIGHLRDVTSVAFSSGGARVLTGSDDKTAKLWDVATGLLLRTFKGHAGEVTSVAFSSDGASVLTGSNDKTAKLWDAGTGRLIRTFKVKYKRHISTLRVSGEISSVAFSPDGARVLTGSMDKTAKLWDTRTARLLRTFKGHNFQVTAVAFSRNGARVLTGSKDKTAKLWDAGTGQLITTLKGTYNWFFSYQGHSGDVTSVALSADGARVLTGSDDKNVRIWDVGTGKLLKTFKGHSDRVWSVAFSPDGTQVLSGSRDATAKLWDVDTGQLLRTFKFINDEWLYGGGHISVAFSSNGARVLTGGNDNKARIWDADTGQLLRTFDGYSGAVNSVAFSPDGRRMLTGSDDKNARIWDAGTGQLLRTFKGHSSRVQSVAFSPDATHALTGSWDSTAKLWGTRTGKLIRTFRTQAGPIGSVAFSPDGSRVLTEGLIRLNSHVSTELWDAGTGLRLSRFPYFDYYNDKPFVFSADGSSVNLYGSSVNLWSKRGTTKTITLRDATTGEPIRVLSKGTWGNFELRDARTGARIRTFNWLSSLSLSDPRIAVTPDGARVLSGSDDKTAKLRDGGTGELLATFKGLSSWVTSVALTPDGVRLLTGSQDGAATLWDGVSGQALVSMAGQGDDNWLSLTPEGFFAGSPGENDILGIVRGLEVTTIAQVHQSLYNPDLVRAKLAGDPDGEVAKAAKVVNLEKVLDSGKVPDIEIVAPKAKGDLIDAEAIITDAGGGIGRIEWRVNGVTAGVETPPKGSSKTFPAKHQLALDPGENTIEVVAYNGRNLLASLPARTTIAHTRPADTIKPNLYVLAIGINDYVDKGGLAPGETEAKRFPPLKLAVGDAEALGLEFKKAGAGFYGDVRVRTVLDGEATAAKLDAVVDEMAGEIGPRDTLVLFAAAHGYSHEGRFYLIPQDYQGGPDPQALAARAIDQLKLQDWIANRIKAKRVLILLDTCESGALTSGYTRSRFDGPASDAAIGRLHEATGRPVLTAAALGQDALELSDLDHGVFTSAVIDSLYHGDTDGNGEVSVSEFAAHVQDLVPKLIKDPKTRAEVVHRGLVGGVQSARFGSQGEDFALVRRLQ